MLKKMNVFSEQAVSLPEVVEILKERKKMERESTVEQKNALEHAKSFSKIKASDAEEIETELKALDIRPLKEDVIINIINVLPKTEKELKVVLSSVTGIKKEEMEKILEIIKKYA